MRERAIPVLTYHRISAAPASATAAPWTVSPSRFAEHLDTLSALGFRGVGASAVIAELERGSNDRIVGLTIDDGYADTPAACDRVVGAGHSCSVFVTTGWIDDDAVADLRRWEGEPRLTWAGLERIASLGVEIGAHSHTHRDLDLVPRAEDGTELGYPKQLIERRLGTEVRGVAWPKGHSSLACRRSARDAGYSFAVAVKNRAATTATNRFAIPRFLVRSTMTGTELARLVEAPPRPRPAALEFTRTAAGRLVRASEHSLRGTR